MSFYINKDDINSDGSIVLYQRPNLKNPKWQVRLKIPNTKGYKTISTGQVDKQEAIRWSRNHYYELSYKVEKGGSIKSKTFGQVFNEWSDFYRNSNISATTGFVEGQISIVERVFLTLLKSKNIETISEEELLLTLVQHKGFRNKKQIEVSRGTRQTYRAAIMRLYNFAVSKKYVEQLPNLKVSGGRPTGRPHFDKKDYNKPIFYILLVLDCFGSCSKNIYIYSFNNIIFIF